MKKNKKLFIYKNRIILTNGSSLKITSVKHMTNYQLDHKIFKENKIKNLISNKNKSNFIKKKFI